ESPAERKAAHRIVGIDTLQRCARLLGVFPHLRGERLRRFKNLVRAEEGDELSLHLLAVEVAGKIEEIGLEHGLVFAEGRAHADITRSMRTAAIMVDAHGIDAVAHVLPWGERKIERGKTEPLASSCPLAHAASRAPPIANLVCRLPHLAFTEVL